MFTKGAQCTGNFVFTDARDRVYVGYAAHCAGRGEATDTNGCQTRSVPLGTPVTLRRRAAVATPGTTVGRGTLAYSSWIDMRRRGTQRRPGLRLQRLRAGAGRVRVGPASQPLGAVLGRPDQARPGLARGRRPDLHLRQLQAARRRRAAGPQDRGLARPVRRGLAHDVYTVTPGIPGDSGSGFLDAQGRAFGVLSTVAAAPLPASNGLGDLYRELRYAQKHSGIAGLRLVAGPRSSPRSSEARAGVDSRHVAPTGVRPRRSCSSRWWACSWSPGRRPSARPGCSHGDGPPQLVGEPSASPSASTVRAAGRPADAEEAAENDGSAAGDLFVNILTVMSRRLRGRGGRAARLRRSPWAATPPRGRARAPRRGRSRRRPGST